MMIQGEKNTVLLWGKGGDSKAVSKYLWNTGIMEWEDSVKVFHENAVQMWLYGSLYTLQTLMTGKLHTSCRVGPHTSSWQNI